MCMSVPLVGMVSRLDEVKGMDLMEPVLEWLLEGEAQFVLLGTGQPQYHEMFERVRVRFPNRMRAFLKFDDVVARRIYAGADVFLMPSGVEPCGLGQMIAMRYGCVPVVRATGGLADTVTDYTARRRRGTGFAFPDYTPEACQDALDRALEGRTSLVIAHRLSTVRNADLILVVDDGRVVQSGSHASLLAAGGLYADLYETQFAVRSA